MNLRFNDALEVGKTGEVIVAEFLEKQGYNVIDVSDDKEYQKQDIDFVIEKDGVRHTLEIKTDNYIATLGTFLFEDVFHKDYGDVKGWLHYCQAEILCMYDTVNRKCYWLDGDVMRQVVKTRSNNYKVQYSSGDSCNKGFYVMEIATAISMKTPGKLVIGRNVIEVNE